MKNTISKLAKKTAEIYRQDGKTFLYHAASVGISTLASAAAAGCFERAGCSPEVNSLATTGVGTGSYWLPFIGMLAASERNQMKNEKGQYDPRRVASKAGKYAAMVGVGEAFFAAANAASNYVLQRCGMDAISAATVSNLGCATIYGLGVPILNHTLNNRSQRRRDLEALSGGAS